MKKITKIYLSGLMLFSTGLIADGGKGRMYNSKNVTTSQCREMYVSGILEIKNKNLDFDENNVLHKTQRISYVVPDEYSLLTKKCHQLLMGADDLPMNKMIKKLD